MNKLQNLKNLARVYGSYILRSEKVSQLPTRIWIEPTPSCNFTCGHCPHGMDEDFEKGLMKMDLFKKIINELEGSVYDVNLFHRGESMIHPQLDEMVRYCSGKGMHTRLHTNAGLLTEEKSRKLIEAGLSYISFSVDGYTKPVYDRNRTGGDFDVTMENIINFLQIKKALGKGPFSIVQVMEIGEEDNKEIRRAEFEQLFEQLPLDRFVVRTPHNWAGDFEEFGSGVGERADVRFTPCTFLWYSMTIFFDGTCPPCPQDFFAKINLGNVAETSVAHVWNSDKMVQMRRRMKARDVRGLRPCETCDILTRKTFMGVPTNYLTTFIKDNFLVK
ncbi:hypothetical protein MNBD_NITROSPINAE02-1593 [hydrothermal vent metagenome]|uniref:Radical SAM protein n=1 Tax=hydrothermal vent metagenome TaxID=652676 RepID=A0A3B1BDW5_9ZZZZ